MAGVTAETERAGQRKDEREATDNGGCIRRANKMAGVRGCTIHQREHDVLVGRGLHNEKEADGKRMGFKRRGRSPS